MIFYLSSRGAPKSSLLCLPAACCISLSHCTLHAGRCCLFVFVHVRLCTPSKGVKTILSLCQPHTPSNSRDVHHMTSVTNHVCVICIMWCKSYSVTHTTWSASHSSCCVTSHTYTSVTCITWSPSPSWLNPYDLRHHRDIPHMICVTMVTQDTKIKITRKLYRG